MADGNTTLVAGMRMDWDGQDKQWLVTAFEDDFEKFARDQKEAYRNDLTDARIPASSEPDQDTVDQSINRVRAAMAEDSGILDGVTFADLPFKMQVGTTARDFLDDLDADSEADAVLQICHVGVIYDQYRRLFDPRHG